MPHFPYFIPVDKRPLTSDERGVIERLLEAEPECYQAQAAALSVVGRCGCGNCPTIFFEYYAEGDTEFGLQMHSGCDASGCLVGAFLLEKRGRLSQLDFFSIDGREPWGIPNAESLEPMEGM